MTDDAPKRFSLRRWSQRKLDAARAHAAGEMPAAEAIAPQSQGSATPAVSADAAASLPATAPVELPAIDTLTLESDFSVFMQPKVDESVKRQALRKLFSEPHFNVMDGLDVYIDDYSIPDPLSPEVARQLVQSRYIFDPPKTRVTAEGHVEDVPPEEVAAVTGEERAPGEEEQVLSSPDRPDEVPSANPAPASQTVVAADDYPREPAGANTAEEHAIDGNVRPIGSTGPVVPALDRSRNQS